jgi:hypothetical protein
VSLVELSVTVRNCNCIVTTAFSTGDDYPYSGLPGSFHDSVLIVMGTIILLALSLH